MRRLILFLLFVLGAWACGDDTPVDDLDGDGFGMISDCNDDDASVNPSAAEVAHDGVDQDCDGHDLLDGDGDGYDGGADGDDCDDEDDEVHPGATDIPYDGVDQDCNGTDASDVDGDGYLSTDSGGDDCDDSRADVSPIGVEICGDELDQNCDGADLDCNEADLDMDGHTTAGGDCDDTDASVNPAATEVPYNGKDDDCDALTRENDLDVDGFIHPGDCDDDAADIHPGADEVPYDGIDQDCDGVDLADVDNDGHDAESAGGDDCDDRRDDIHPGIEEIPYDTIDQDCNGSDLIGQPMLISSADRTQYEASVAYAGGNYLVVWHDGRDPAIPQVYAQLVAGTGALVGSEILVRVAPQPRSLWANTNMEVEVASSASNFLVLWREFIGGLSAQVFGQLVNLDGTLDGSPFNVGSETAGTDWEPAAAFNGTRYVVAFRAAEATVDDRGIRTRTVDLDGTLGSTVSLTVNSGFVPAIASEGPNSMVVWRETSTEILVRPVDVDGAPIRAATAAVSRSGIGAFTVAFGGTTYMVTAAAGTNLWGQRVDTTGTPTGTTADTNFAVSNALGGQANPAMAMLDDAFSTVFTDSRWGQAGIYTQRVDTDGTLFGSASGDNVPIFAGADPAQAPAMASSGSTALVVWSTSGNIVSHRLTP